jgi:transposase
MGNRGSFVEPRAGGKTVSSGSVALFVMTLPYSGAIFMQAFPRECTETFLEGHRRAFEFFGGVPRLAVAIRW